MVQHGDALQAIGSRWKMLHAGVSSDQPKQSIDRFCLPDTRHDRLIRFNLSA